MADANDTFTTIPPRSRIAHALRGTLLLSLTGAIVGALVGFILLAAFELRSANHDAALIGMSVVFGGGFGAIVGAIVAPLAGWTLLRRVPFGQAILGTAAGTLIGGIAGDIVFKNPILTGIAGYVVASAILFIRSGRRARPQPSGLESSD